MAAGEGRRLRPITERWPKPILPIDGRPVVVTLVHELAAAGCGPIVVVTGHLAEQVEELLEPLRTTSGSSASRRGSARPTRSPRAEATPPYVVTAADTVYAEGDLARFAAEGAASRRRDRRPRRLPAAALAARGARCPVPRPATGSTAV